MVVTRSETRSKTRSKTRRGGEAATKKVTKKPAKRKTTNKPNLTPSLLWFDAKRGDHASCNKSKSADYCNIPGYIMMELSEMFRVENEMSRTLMQYPTSTYCEVLTRMMPASCMRQWRITKFMGSGASAYVFGCRHKKTNSAGALKIFSANDNSLVRSEVNSHNKFSKLHLSPKIISHCSLRKGRRKIYFLNMSRVDTTLYKWLAERRSKKLLDKLITRIFDILLIMEKHNVTHGDLHLDNIGFVYGRGNEPGRIKILDYGYASTARSMPEIELVQFVRTLHSRYTPRINRENANYLIKQCRAESKRLFDLSIPRSLTHIEERFSQLRRKLKRS